MFFYRGDLRPIKAIDTLLDIYASCFGQVCNASKFIVYASVILDIGKYQISTHIGFSIGNSPLLYMGSPIFIGKPKPKHFHHNEITETL